MKNAKSSKQRQSNQYGNSIINNTSSVRLRQEEQLYRQSVIRYEDEEIGGFLQKPDESKGEK